MTQDSTRTAADSFYADEYERLYSSYLNDASIVVSICSYLKSKITPEHTILVDLGCGVGIQLRDISRTLSIPTVQCCGIDVSPSMQERFEKAFGDSKAIFLNGDFLNQSFAEQLSRLIVIDSELSDVVILCLGNTLGLVEQKLYSRIAEIANTFPKGVNVFCLFEYRDGDTYRALCPVGEMDVARKGSQECFGSAEVIGQHESDYFAFYIRTPVDELRYSVNLFALSKENKGSSVTCAMRGLYIEKGYYVNPELLKSVFLSAGFTIDPQFKAASALEAGETIMFRRISSNG